MLFFSKEATAAAIAFKILGPVVQSCLADQNSWLSKKLNPQQKDILTQVMQFFSAKTSAIDEVAEVKKIL